VHLEPQGTGGKLDVMGSDPSNLKLAANTETVEDLTAMVRRGVVRIPSFQRGLRWRTEDVLALFDSIYRGYPVGSFLLRKGAAAAATLKIGPLSIDGPETQEALWVVDGQQRLIALTAGLSRSRPVPTTPIDIWVVYFDPEEQTFKAPPKTGEIPSTWVPVAEMLDASVLSEWVFNWRHGGDPGLRTRLFQAGTRLRQYEISVYTVETEDEQLLRDIFYRINNFGRSLEWNEVHDALFGRREDHPSTLRELAAELQKLGMGRPEERDLLSCVTAFKGLDVTRNISEHYRKNADVLTRAVQEALPAVRGVLSFFRRNAEIPHLRLLPRSIPLVVLTRFFGLYPDPKSRTLDLLVRWTWRTLLSTSFLDERTLLRHGVDAIQKGDEEGSVQRLLALVPRERRSAYSLPPRFDARAAGSRLALLGLSSLRPLSLKDGSPIDVATLIENDGVAAFRRILSTEDQPGSSPANRIFLPGSGSARRELAEYSYRQELDPAVLRSHAFTTAAMAAFRDRDRQAFVNERTNAIEEAVNSLGERLAAWTRTDRPSISYLLQQVGAGG
jgi:Protein of unknown function DUF262